MRETVQILNWDRTVAGRIYAEDTEALLNTGNYERICDGVLRHKPKNDNGGR